MADEQSEQSGEQTQEQAQDRPTQSAEVSVDQVTASEPLGKAEPSSMLDEAQADRMRKADAAAAINGAPKPRPVEMVPQLMMPSIGRIVHYKLRDTEATAVNALRKKWRETRAVEGQAHWRSQPHQGNDVREGSIVAMLIVAVWGPSPTSAVNGQAFLDGNDSIWITSVSQGEGPGFWSAPPRA